MLSDTSGTLECLEDRFAEFVTRAGLPTKNDCRLDKYVPCLATVIAQD
jgi:hypothetical protein